VRDVGTVRRGDDELMFSLIANHWNDHDGDWFPFFPLIPLFFIGVWVFVIVTFRRRWLGAFRHTGESVLAERYARGEIDESEFRQRRDVLRERKPK
jgi:putative membrane protein